MKVARLYSFNDIKIEDVEIPETGDNGVLMRVRACGVCSGEAMKWYIEKKAPLVLGHEPSGEIVRVGRNVNGFKPGDRIFVHHHAPCMECRFCMRGDYVQCDGWKGSRIVPGGISEYIAIPDNILRNDTLLLPEGVSYEDATLIEPAACVVKSLRRADIRRDDTILVIGLGVMGMIHILLARDIGAEMVIGADMVKFRLDKAREFGADHVVDVKNNALKKSVDEFTKGRGADVVFICPSSISAIMNGFECVAPGGRVVLFTPLMPGEKLTLDPNYIYFNDINIITSYSCGPNDTRAAMEYIKRGTIKAERLITHRFRIDETPIAYKTVAEAGDSLKVIIIF